eukprot:15484077-Alexandrium_andersonii.AAC.1
MFALQTAKHVGARLAPEGLYTGAVCLQEAQMFVRCSARVASTEMTLANKMLALLAAKHVDMHLAPKWLCLLYTSPSPRD